MKEWVLLSITSIIFLRNCDSWNLQEREIESSVFKIVTYLPILTSYFRFATTATSKKKTLREKNSCYMVNINSFTIQGEFITINALNSLQ